MNIIGKNIRFVIDYSTAIEQARKLENIIRFNHNLLKREQYAPKITPKKNITPNLSLLELCEQFRPSTKKEIISNIKRCSREAFEISLNIRSAEELGGLNELLSLMIKEGYLKLKEEEISPFDLATKEFYWSVYMPKLVRKYLI